VLWRWIIGTEIVTIIGDLVIWQNIIRTGEQKTELGKEKDWNMRRIDIIVFD